MRLATLLTSAGLWCALTAAPLAAVQGVDARLREVIYDPNAVVTVPVKRGVVTLVVLGADEAIAEVAAGLGGDCSKAESVWCIAALPGGRSLFVKPKSGAKAANTLAVVTDRRSHSFRFVVLPDDDARAPLYRLIVKPPSVPAAPLQRLALDKVAEGRAVPALRAAPPALSPDELVANRLKAKPHVLNTNYSIAEGKGSDDIVPALVFDDGRFTYLRFPGNRQLPAVFHVLADGSETLVNTRMEDDLLVVDRVSERLMLRAGSAVAGVRNEAFELDSEPAIGSTTVPGVRRELKAERSLGSAHDGATP